MSKRHELEAEYVPVYAAAGMVEANLVQSILEGAGIRVVLFAESAGTAFGLSVGDLGEVEVWVPRANKAEAEELLAQMNNPAAGDDTPE